MKANPIKVIYILGHPYSGSTLFAVALGNSKDLVNLGEVSSLENDYQETVCCLCGKCLSECEFWQKIKAALDETQSGQPIESRFQLNYEGTFSGPDKRSLPLLVRLQLMFGVNYAFREKELENYALKSEVFFQAVSAACNGRTIIDASKSPYRLPILLERTDLDLKIIWLKRSMKNLFSSKMKRVREDSRLYIPFITPAIYIAWLLNYHWACSRVYGKLPNSQKQIVDYKIFLRHPRVVQEALTKFLESEVDFKIDNNNLMAIADQHVYVGNRWLFENRGVKDVKVNDDDSVGKLSSGEENVYRFFSLMFPVLRN